MSMVNVWKSVLLVPLKLPLSYTLVYSPTHLNVSNDEQHSELINLTAAKVKANVSREKADQDGEGKRIRHVADPRNGQNAAGGGVPRHQTRNNLVFA